MVATCPVATVLSSAYLAANPTPLFFWPPSQKPSPPRLSVSETLCR